MNRTTISLAAVAAAALAAPATAGAAFTTSSISASAVTLTGDAAADTVTVGSGGGLLTHGLSGAGFASAADWDTNTAGEQTLPADGSVTVTLAGAGGDDALAFAATVEVAKAILDGGPGNDVLTATNKADELRGGDGNDRVTGVRGDDDMEGGAGNDVLVWNNGDNSDVMDGDAGNDAVEVNGAATAGDVFTLRVDGQRLRFDRTNLVPFNLSIGTTERVELNGLGGADTMTAADGLGSLLLTMAGGPGADVLTGGDAHDVLLGGEENDTLSGGGGDDRIVGDRGDDVMKGGAGDDALVWNNGDNSDAMDGDDGADVVEVNGAVAAGDAFTIAPNGARTRFERTNLVPFTLDVAAEAFDVRGHGGDDTLAVAEGSAAAVRADGGAGNDALTGAGGADTLAGGSGNDVLTGGGGVDVLDGGAGDDRMAARDGGADVARCGDGSDSVVGDRRSVDVLVACEVTELSPAASVAAAVARTIAIRRRGSGSEVRWSVVCPASAVGGCTGTITLTAARPVRVAGVKVRPVFGERSIKLAAGRRKTVRLRLSRSVRRVAGSRILARAVTRAVAEGGVAADSSARLRLRLPG